MLVYFLRFVLFHQPLCFLFGSLQVVTHLKILPLLASVSQLCCRFGVFCFNGFHECLLMGFKLPNEFHIMGLVSKDMLQRGLCGFFDVKWCFLIPIWTIRGVLFFISLNMCLVVVCTNQHENMDFHLFKLVQTCA